MKLLLYDTIFLKLLQYYKKKFSNIRDYEQKRAV